MRLPLAPGLLVAALTAGTASAQPPSSSRDQAEAPRFNTDVVVTPERGETPRALVPASTIVIDRSTLVTLPAVHLAEAVSFLPGFNIMRAALYAGRPLVSSRGFFGGGEAEYVTLLVDGVRVADVESGLIDWSAVSSSAIRRVEAYRGPATSLYGDAAVGGVIQILTDRPAHDGELTFTAGSYKSFTADGAYGHRSSRAGIAISGAARRTDGGFDHSFAGQVIGTASVDGSAGGYSWRWSTSGGTRDRDDPGVLSVDALRVAPFSSDPMFRFDTLDRRDVSTAFTLRNGNAMWQPQARVYVTRRGENLIRTIPLAPGIGDRRARELSSAALGASVEAEHTFGTRRPAVLRAGVDLAREYLDTRYRGVSNGGATGALESEAEGHRVRAGLFAFGSWQATARVRLSTGVRRDVVDDNGFGGSPATAQRAWSPRAGVSVQLTKGGDLVLFAQVSRAFKAPTLDQLFDPRPYPNFRGGTFTISNRHLVPQRAGSAEIGVSGGDRVRLSALAYRMVVDNEIDFDLRTFSYANIRRSRHVGAELEAEGRWWKRVRPSVTYALTRVGDPDGSQQLKNVPRHLATIGASFEFPWAIGVVARYNRTWGAFLDDANLYPLDGHSMLDARARRAIGRHVLFVDALNAMNHVSEEYGFTLADFRGRVVQYVYPGAPRAVRVGLTVSF